MMRIGIVQEQVIRVGFTMQTTATIYSDIGTTFLPPAKVVRHRVTSIDAMRGLVMLLMIFVNKLAGDANVPQWLDHYEGKGSGLTFVDLVFPAFLFIAGMSIPFALGARLKRGEPLWLTSGHVLLRAMSLLLIGVMMVNGTPDSIAMGWSCNGWVVLMYASVIAAFCSIGSSAKTANEMNTTDRRVNLRRIILAVRGFGLLAIFYLALAYRGPQDQRIIRLSPFSISVQWWGILGHIGWAYLLASIVFLCFRTRMVAVLGCLALMVAMYSADRHGAFAGFWPARYVSFAALGTHSMLATGGMLLGIMLVTPEMNAVATRVKFTLLFAVGFGVAAWLLHGEYGISKIAATPAWGLIGCAVTALAWLTLYLVGDVLHITAVSRPLAASGQNVLLAYLISVALNPIFRMLGLLDWYYRLANDLPTAIYRAAGTSLSVVFLAYGLNYIGFRLKL